MVSTLAECIGKVAPYYNLVLVALVIIMFITLFKKKHEHYYHLPWKLLFIGVLIFVAETALTIMEGLGVIDEPSLVAPFMEMVIITLFIYMLLMQREYVKSIPAGKKSKGKK